MSVIFEANIKVNRVGNWYIEIKDTVDGRVEICNNLEEFSTKIEEMGTDYGGQIDEVKWNVDENVRPDQLDEVRLGMAKYQEEFANDSND